MPTIAELLMAYRDRTGASYGDMARKVRDEITISRLQQLATAPPKEFPKATRTVELLSELLDLPLATIVLAFAAGLGIPVAPSRSDAVTLPPGTDTLAQQDRDAIRAVTRALIDARNRAFHDPAPISGPEPATQHDYTLAARRGPSEGKRLRREQDGDAESQ